VALDWKLRDVEGLLRLRNAGDRGYAERSEKWRQALHGVL
jgi:hypothetical protein